MPEHHHHEHEPEAMGRRLLVSMLINLLIPAAQIAGGIFAGSMAVISDAIHNIGDFTALLVAYAAHLTGKRGPSLSHTFGLKRMEVFAAVINAALLGGSAVFIASESIKRLKNPEPVMAGLVAVLALVGIAGNGLSAWLLHKDAGHSLNAKGAFLHMMGDLFTSVAVLAGAGVMHFFRVLWLDPALGLVIVVYIIYNCIALLRESVHVLMNGTPKGLNLMEVKAAMEALDGVTGVHYMHAWDMGNQSLAFTCHVVVPDQSLSASEKLLETLGKMLAEKFGIDHPVLQLETRACGVGDSVCQLSCGESHATCGHNHH